ncbi:MAG: DUF4430 domain-containing protein [Actinobacteria bacterium]|nr:DUF4430 domain-containing protein [Actinomycetota bacterium]
MSRTGKRAIMWTLAAILVVGVTLFALKGCTLMPWNKETAGGEPVSVLITRDFGGVLITDESVRPRSGDSVMDVLLQVAEVETGYGGGFVSAIDGLGSGSGESGRSDWFYYVNGVLSGLGADEYQVEGGDKIWWDHHSWNESNFIPAVVGSYPMPFTRGYSREETLSTVLFSDYLESLARQVGGYLAEGGARVQYEGDLPGFICGDRSGPVIAFVTFEDARKTGWITELLASPGKTGAFLTFDGDRPVPLDSNGDPAPLQEEISAAVLACGSGIGDPFPVWLVLCDGEDGVKQAGRLLVSGSQGLSRKVGVVVAGGNVYSLPR